MQALFRKHNFAQSETSLKLAQLRIAIFATLALFTILEFSKILWFSEIPKELLFLPGCGWAILKNYLPINPSLALIAGLLLIMTSILSVFGIYAKANSIFSWILALYVLGIPNFFGKVNHQIHFVIACAIIISFAPCANRLSLYPNASQASENAGENEKSALALEIIFLLIGVLYFFSGFWKIKSQGMGWFTGENIRNIIYWRWFEIGYPTNSFRIDYHTYLYRTGGLLTVLFEISCVFFISWPKTRRLVLFFALVFHLVIALSMNIIFWPFVPAYLVLITYNKNCNHTLLDLLKNAFNSKRPSYLLIASVGCVIIFLNCYFGIKKQIAAWPFSCFPTFDVIASTEREELILGIGSKGGKKEKDGALYLRKIKQRFGYERFRGLEEKILYAKINQQQRYLNALARVIRKEVKSIRAKDKIIFYKAFFSTKPEDYPARATNKSYLASF